MEKFSIALARFANLSIVYVLSFLISIEGLAQVSVIQGQYPQNIESKTNYVRNKGCWTGVRDITASGGSLTRNTTTPLENGSDCAIDASASAQTYSWATFSFDRSLAGSNCEAKFIFKGDASLYKAYVNVNSVKVSNDVQLTNAADPQPISINFPCGAQPLTTVVVIESTAVGAALINVSNMYAGPETNLGMTANITEMASYTPIISAWAANTTVTGKWRQVGDGIEGTFNIALTGAPTGTLSTITVPSVCVIDTSKTDNVVFDYHFPLTIRDSGTATYVGRVAVGTSTSALNLDYNGGGTPPSMSAITATAPMTWANGDNISGYFKVPCVGFRAEQTARINSIDTTGEVKAIAGSCPNGTLEANGSAVSRSTYSTLFAKIGITHGQGDGSTTFNLPDYRGRFLRGQANGSANDPDRASRTAMNTGGATGDAVGSVQADQYLSHTHTQDANFVNAALTQTNLGLVNGSGTTAYTQMTLNGKNTGSAGGNETRPKNAYVKFCIVTESTASTPVLVGSVTSNSLGAERTERASFNAACNSITSQSGNWVSAPTDTGSPGACQATIASGLFSATPACQVTCRSSSGVPRMGWLSSAGSTNVLVTGFCGDAAGTLQATAMDIICMGPR